MKKIMKGVVFGLACNCLFSGVASGMNSAIEAVKKDDVDTFSRIVSQINIPLDFYAKESDLCSIVNCAIESGSVRILKYLALQGGGADCFLHLDSYVFWRAFEQGNREVINLLCNNNTVEVLQDKLTERDAFWSLCRVLERRRNSDVVEFVLENLPEGYWRKQVKEDLEKFITVLETGNYEAVISACGDDVNGTLSDAAELFTWNTLVNTALRRHNLELFMWMIKNLPQDFDWSAFRLYWNWVSEAARGASLEDIKAMCKNPSLALSAAGVAALLNGVLSSPVSECTQEVLNYLIQWFKAKGVMHLDNLGDFIDKNNSGVKVSRFDETEGWEEEAVIDMLSVAQCSEHSDVFADFLNWATDEYYRDNFDFIVERAFKSANYHAAKKLLEFVLTGYRGLSEDNIFFAQELMLPHLVHSARITQCTSKLSNQRIWEKMIMTQEGLEVLQLFLKMQNVNVNAQLDWNGNTALHEAVSRGDYAAVKYILQHPDVDVDITNKRGETASEVSQDTDLSSSSVSADALAEYQVHRQEAVDLIMGKKTKFDSLDTSCYEVCYALSKVSPEEVQRVIREWPKDYWKIRVFVHPEEFLAILNTGNFELVRLACGDDVNGALSDAVFRLGELYEIAQETGNAQLIDFIRKNEPEIDYKSYKPRLLRFENPEEIRKAITEGKMKI